MSDWKRLTSHGLTSNIAVSEILVDPIFQMRENGTDENLVNHYAGIMEANDPDGWHVFPDITLLMVTDPDEFDDEGWSRHQKYYVIGGFHRFGAIQQRGYEHVTATVVQGNVADGIAFAAGENADQSRRRTQADIRRAVTACLYNPNINQWSNGYIARICHVDPQTVANHEKRFYATDPSYKRPEKLKFVDKHGGTSLRKHSIPKIGVEETKEVLIPDDTERKQLLSDVTDLHVQSIAGYVEAEAPLEREQRTADLIREYPAYDSYSRRDTLSVSELKELHATLEKIAKDVKQRWATLCDEIWDLWHEEIDELMTDVDWKTEDEREEAIKKEYPGFAKFDGYRWKLSYVQMECLKSTLEAIKAEIEANGDTAYLPESYFEEQVTEEAEDGGPIKKASKQAVNAAILAANAANKAFELLMGDKNKLSWVVTNRQMPNFISAYNKQLADPADKFPRGEQKDTSWGMDDFDEETVKRIERNWKRIEQACLDRPDWVRDWIYDRYCRLSQFEIFFSDEGRTKYDAYVFKASCPLSEAELHEIFVAAQQAAEQKYFELTAGKYRKK